MKPKSIVDLLEVGHFIYRKQQAIQRLFGTYRHLFDKELQLVLEIILIDMGVIRVKAESTCVVNTDHYEFLVEKLREYYENEISVDQMVDFTQALELEGVYFLVHGGVVKKDQSMDIVSRLFELKYGLQSKRNQFTYLISNGYNSIRIEKKILQLALEKLGGNGYPKRA
jgi:hypothetical protein